MAYSEYAGKGRSIGRLMFYINKYCGLRPAEMCTFGHPGGVIMLYDKPFATVGYAGKEENAIPIFCFVGEHADSYNKTQVGRCEEAVEEEREIVAWRQAAIAERKAREG